MTDPDQRRLRTFILSVSLAVAVCVSGGFLGMAVRQRSLIQAEMVARARTDFRNLVHFRQWNARYGGVLVEKRPGVLSDPWLEHPDVQGADGRVFTRKNLALVDDLTGILNRRAVFDRLEGEMERHRRSGLALSCILMDIDRFKEINDRLGHLKGDLALRDVAARIREALRTYDGLGRYGGEEFLAVLPGTALEAARGVAERIRAGVAAGVRIDGSPGEARPVTLSLGVAQWDGAEDANGLVHRVDIALYRAKAGGRNRVEPA